MRLSFLAAALAIALLSFAAQTIQQPTFSTDVKLVNIFATVRDKNGEMVKNLTQDDFILEEDGKPQTIRYFSQESNLPLTLGLLIDTSLSQRHVLPEERRTSYQFLEKVLREDKDLAFLIHFDREVELLQDLTSSRKLLEKALENVELPQTLQRSRSPGTGPRRNAAGTLLYDSVLLASDELMRKQTGRKALVLLTDGVDTGSRTPLSTAIETAQRADTLAYSILFFDKDAYGAQRAMPMPRGRRGPRSRMPNRPDGKKILQKLSLETGGSFFEVSKKLTLDEVFHRIEEELRNQYSIGFIPSTSGTTLYRKIRLITRQKNLIVQARDGYYPAP